MYFCYRYKKACKQKTHITSREGGGHCIKIPKTSIKNQNKKNLFLHSVKKCTKTNTTLKIIKN